MDIRHDYYCVLVLVHGFTYFEGAEASHMAKLDQLDGEV